MKVIFEYQLTIKEFHLDTFGHVNNATYLQIYEEARWDLLVKQGFGIPRIQKDKIGPVLLELNLKFKRELKNRSVIKITSEFTGLKNSKIMTMHQEMLNEDGKVMSTLDIDVGLMDLAERKLVVPSIEWLKVLGAD